MHLLATTSGVVDGGAEAINLKQSPGDIVVLSAADSELAALALASDQLPGDFPTIRLANLLQLQHNYSVDLYTEQTLAQSKLIIVRLLGGKSYWPYGVERLLELDAKIVFLPGGTEPDAVLTALSTVPASDCEILRQHLAHGGPENALNFWRYAYGLIRHPGESRDPQPDQVPAFAGMTLPTTFPKSGPFRNLPNKGSRIGVVFYRALLEGGLVAPINALCDKFEKHGHSVSALYVASLKDKTSADLITSEWNVFKPDVIINATSFAIGNPDADPLKQFECPVLQVTLAGMGEDDWRNSSRGLGQKDLAMSVVLPELDGRIYTRAISFKADAGFHTRTQCRIITHRPLPDRIAFVAEQAIHWAALRHKPNAEKHIAIILANYPNKDGRIANGVGYDTPASTINILKALETDGYRISRHGGMNGNALIEALQAQRTNAASGKSSSVQISIPDYENHFAVLPADIRAAVAFRWGIPASDPFVQHDAFQLPLLQFDNAVVGIQPARGYNIDPKSTYHDPALVPPHGYFAFYFWLRHHFKADAIIHNGKHGNLEWLPGKAVGLSEDCYPEALLGPVPHIYPFIVNDPGEGTSAKRRSAAVIIDHLTPPLTRAESYGPLKDLEALVDEYYLASGLDPRRLKLLKEKILELTRHHNMDKDAGFTGDDDADLQKLDTFLCDLKEAQIRDGLHILGESPGGKQETDLLVALTRVPSGDRPSLIKAIADDLELGFDPLNCQFADEWMGPRPEVLNAVSRDAWRTVGDAVERLEVLAAQLVDTPPPPFGGAPPSLRAERVETTSSRAAWGSTAKPGGGVSTHAVLKFINTTLRPTLASCGASEIANLLRALNGLPVPPGPSGAPTRGRLDVLPTGRNFYSLDNRTLPTPAAWQLGKLSADALLTRHFQDTGQHLKTIGLSVWGTANMRTGGDDLAQALWLLGAKPVWDTASWRVTGFEVQPLAAIGRPRVDVTLRISGFFRDAFPQQIELMDKAIRAVAALDEAPEDNPLAASPTTSRIFGSKPGAYGAGLQAMIDEGIWQTKHDLAAAYVTWGSYVYGTKDEGRADPQAFRDRLAKIEAVIHNQDNREHDLLDSDDYYQFEGGMSAAVETASGSKPRVYHNDHSRPERPVIRTLEEEISRVMRSRVVNPKWIKGVKRHGYKGAFEIAATVDYMFAFAATADAVKSHHFDLAFDAYINDDDTRKFMADNNPQALKEMCQRFAEAISRGLWQPHRNDVHDRLKELAQ